MFWHAPSKTFRPDCMRGQSEYVAWDSGIDPVTIAWIFGPVLIALAIFVAKLVIFAWCVMTDPACCQKRHDIQPNAVVVGRGNRHPEVVVRCRAEARFDDAID